MRRFIMITAITLLALTPALASAQTYAPVQTYGGAQTYGSDPNALVDSWYRTYLGRAPDSGMTYWVNHLLQGDSPDAVIAGILGSDEYYLKSGGTPAGFVNQVFNDLLRRPPTPRELDFWARRLYTEPRSEVAQHILTQNPGVWVGATTTTSTVAPPAVSGVIITPSYRWERERHEDWQRRHEVYDYRRPVYPYRQ